MKSLPKDFFPFTFEVEIRVTEQDYVSVNLPKAVSIPFQYCGGYYGSSSQIEISRNDWQKSPFKLEVQDMIRENVRIQKLSQDIKREFLSVSSSCKTVKKLKDLWPEVEQYSTIPNGDKFALVPKPDKLNRLMKSK